MSRICEVTGKKPSVGNSRSHAMNATLRRFVPNLFVKRVKDKKTGMIVKMKVSAKALRTLDKLS